VAEKTLNNNFRTSLLLNSYGSGVDRPGRAIAVKHEIRPDFVHLTSRSAQQATRRCLFFPIIDFFYCMQVVSGGRHHVYVDRSAEFNSAGESGLRLVDRGPRQPVDTSQSGTASSSGRVTVNSMQ